jgi:hypothetical protein
MKVVHTATGHLLYFDDELWDIIFDVYGYKVSKSGKGRFTVQASKGKYAGKVLARFITNCPKELYVDHINGNTLDNRLCNLRIVTAQQNNFNSSPYSSKKQATPKGVRKCGLMYKAYISSNYTRYYLGTFSSSQEAEAAYKKAAEDLFGEHAFHLSRTPDES